MPTDETDFLKSLGIDQTVIDKLRANAGANLIMSGVTSKPRRVVWTQGPLGGVYATLDVETVQSDRDPLRRPLTSGGLQFQFDVSEWYATAPNGMWRTALFNAAGKRQDSVPDKVAKDTSEPLGDGIVAPFLSCARCHKESGLRPFSDDQTALQARGASIGSYDAAVAQRSAEFYDEPRLQRQMSFDRGTYTAALDKCTGGMKPAEFSEALAEVVRDYLYEPVGFETAAREVGCDPKTFIDRLKLTHDPILLAMITGRKVLRGQFQSSFQEAALACAGE